MAVTYTATALGAYSTSLRNSLVCTAAGASEAVTLVHNLGACPTEIRAALRSLVTSPSGMGLPGPIINSLNASIAILNFGGGAQGMAGAAYFDLIAEVRPSIVS